jgi:predicted transposase YbfD/YdcC
LVANLEVTDGAHVVGRTWRDRGCAKSRGGQYRLRSVLGIATAAMLAGANDLRAIYRWGQRLRPEALPRFDITNGKAPCHATYHCFFQSLDADAVARVLGSHAMNVAVPGHIAIDAKTLKGSRRLDAKAIHVLSAFSTEMGAVIGDLVVAPDKNEINAALVLLKGLPLARTRRRAQVWGAVITGDVIFTQRKICRHIRDNNGHYLFVVKDNQLALKAGIAAAFGHHQCTERGAP